MEGVAPLRPFRTAYYSSSHSKPGDWNAVGHAASLRGAARAAFTRILDRRAALALIHDESGVVIARIYRNRGIHAIGV